MFDINELIKAFDEAGEERLVELFTTISDLKRKRDEIREERAIKAMNAMNDFIKSGGKMLLYKGGKTTEINTANTVVEVFDGKLIIDDATFN